MVCVTLEFYSLVRRFLLIKDDATKMYKIRALQGHTVDIKDLDLIPLTLDDTCMTPFVIHGTFWKVCITHNSACVIFELACRHMCLLCKHVVHVRFFLGLGENQDQRT